jgi:carboxypeptidase T
MNIYSNKYSMKGILNSLPVWALLFLFFLPQHEIRSISPDMSLIKYVKVEFETKGKEEITSLIQEGLVFESIYSERLPEGKFKNMAVLRKDYLTILQKKNKTVQILIPDLEEFYRTRSLESESLKESSKLKSDPALFSYGSIGGFYSPAEITQKLDELQQLYPNLISERSSLGKSLENRDLWMVKVSDNPDIDEDEPEVMFDAMHHAREPESIMTLFYFIEYLLENYGTDSLATYLVNNREIYFVPLVNIDGYNYNCVNSPDGGGMWRKNMRTINDVLYGVDLNRNYGYQWGYDNIGSSPDPQSAVYRGETGFSESETQVMRDFTHSHKFKTNLSLHTYSDLFLYPYGYDEVFPDDFPTYIQWADDVSQFNGYQYGTCWELLYPTNGGSFDYNCAVDSIYSFSPELGNADDGFWPQVNRILPLARMNLKPLLYITQAAGWLPSYTDVFQFSDRGVKNGYADPGDTIYIQFEIRNKGLGAMDNWSLELQSHDPYIRLLSQTSLINDPINGRSSVFSDTLGFIIKSYTSTGYFPKLNLRLTAGGVTTEFPVKNFIVGTPINLFSDDGTQGMDRWNTNRQWDTISDWSTGSKNLYFTDSPFGNYQDNMESYLRFDQPLTVHSNARVFLEYKTRYEIEPYYDAAMVQITFNGFQFYTLTGALSKPDSLDRNPDDVPQYFGVKQNWTKEVIDISDLISQQGYGNHSLYVRFLLRTDVITNRAGWDIDDIRVYELQNLASLFSLPDTSYLCSGREAVLSVNPYSSYSWSTGDTTQGIRIENEGWYSVTVTDYLGDQASDSTFVLLYQEPVVDLGTDYTFVPGTGLALDAGDFDFYLWNTGDTTRTITVMPDTWESDTAWFIVHITDLNGCSDCDTIILTREFLGTTDLGMPDPIRIYPNPVASILTIEIEGMDIIHKLEIYSINGGLVFSKEIGNKSVIDLQFLPQGVYFVKISNCASTCVKKLIKLNAN